MRVFIVAAVLALQTLPAGAQERPLASGIGSGLGSSLDANVSGGIGSGLESGLGQRDMRTMADNYDQFGKLGSLGNDCAPSQLDPDHRGCRPLEYLRGERPDPNRVVTYTGDSAFRSDTTTQDPNRRF